MNESLMLPVSYKGSDYEFPLAIMTGGYAPRFAVQVAEVEVIYERDDAGAFRAIIHNQEQLGSRLPDKGLLEAIGNVLQEAAG